jgi:hypothetical protein
LASERRCGAGWESRLRGGEEAGRGGWPLTSSLEPSASNRGAVKLARPPPSPRGGGRRRRGSTASPYPLKAAANAHVWSLRPPPPGTRRLRQVCTSPRVRDAVQSSALSRHSLKGGDSPHVGGLFGEHCSVVVERGCILHAQHVQPHLALRTSRDTGPAPPTLQPPTRRPCTKGTGHTPACPCTGSASVSPRRVLSRTRAGLSSSLLWRRSRRCLSHPPLSQL